MTTKMLIDAAHPEETRVVVVRGNRVEEFDFESANRRPLRGNIYLAKVTRVEPSLQAAFVDFGGNRHGFLAFSEIHPDYYQIPTADRQALLAEEAEAAREEDEEEEGSRRSRRPRGRGRDKKAANTEALVSDPAEGEEEAAAEAFPEGGEDAPAADEHVEQLGGGGDAMEEVPTRSTPRARKQYKIQEVIKRRQILLVQVVKEERGNKGAALTTYLSLAGRYSVLMPNTARGGGISRKITSSTDRKRLKSMASELEVPQGMGVILRTAGASRTKVEIKRDFEYLMRLWESVRSLTLESTAPTLVYEEGSLIKRAIRDLYSKDIEEVLVSGDEGYREAKDFMRMLMPSHAKAVQPYREETPVFSRFGVEAQLDAMFSNVVTLKSGGYIVMNQTEALVSIDVNSGRSTREHNIEDTALKTNLEAAEEVARQLRLRDLAGLVVIDFIDMEEKRNNKAVERKFNECLKNDRARIQVGRISHFGLLEMSRQRIRTGVLESSSVPCPHCAGTGLLRSTPSLALHVLRALEDTLLRAATHDIILRTRMETAFYILNQKRESLIALEARFGVSVTVMADNGVAPGQHFLIERGESVSPPPLAEGEGSGPQARPAPASRAIHLEDIEIEDESEPVEEEAAESEEIRAEGENAERKRRRRRRRRGRDRAEREGRAEGEGAEGAQSEEDPEEEEEGEALAARDEGEANGDNAERKRRRRRRGGRRNRREREALGEDFATQAPEDEEATNDDLDTAAAAGEMAEQAVTPDEEAAQSDAAPAEAALPRKPRRTRAKKSEPAPLAESGLAASGEDTAAEAPGEAVEEKPAAKPRRGRKAAVAAAVAAAARSGGRDEARSRRTGGRSARAKGTAADGTEPQQAPPRGASLREEASAPPALELQAAPEVKAAPAPRPEVEVAEVAIAEVEVAEVEVAEVEVAEAEVAEVEVATGPKRTGWWVKTKQALGGA